MSETQQAGHGAVAGQVERGVRPLVDERGPLGTLRFELRKVLAMCASERCAPEIGATLEALLESPQWDAAAATYHDFRRECNDTDAVLHVLGLDPVKCRTDGGSLKLVMLLGAIEHRDVMRKREVTQALRGERDVLVRLLLEADKVVSTSEGECQEEWDQLADLRRAIAAATIPHRPEEADLLSLRACIGA